MPVLPPRLTDPPGPRAAKVVHVRVGEGLAPIEVEPRYDEVLLVVSLRRAVLGEVRVPARGTLGPDEQREAVLSALGHPLSVEWLRTAFLRAAGAAEPPERAAPDVSVIVCTRDRPADLRRCLDGLARLRTPPLETLVVDNAPTDDGARAACADRPVCYLREPLRGQARARNRGLLAARGELVAFTDDDCVVDPGWLDGLAAPFADPLVMGVTGPIAPLELETRSQVRFELHGGFQKHPGPVTFQALGGSPVVAASVAGAGANMVFRRTAFARVGAFAEDLGPGTPARSADDKEIVFRLLDAGYRVAWDPGRLVWHAHRREPAALRRILRDYTVSDVAYTTRCLVAHRDWGALRIWAWWGRHLLDDARRLARGEDGALPARAALAEATGALAGPGALRRSVRSRRGIPALPAPAPDGRPAGGRDPSAEAPRVTSEPPRVTVAVASHNRREGLVGVLEALARQSYPFHAFEVVVVVDGSTDGTVERVRGLETPYALRVLPQDNRGVAACRNRGAREAAEPVVAFLDDDIEPVPEWVAEHAAAHAAASGAHMVLGYYPPVLSERGWWPLVMREWWEDHFRVKGEPAHQWTFLDFVDGNCSFPRSLLLDAGGYDEAFRGRRQDWELGARLVARGTRFAYRPAAMGRHHLQTDLPTALRNSRQEARWDVALARKHPSIKAQLPLAGWASEHEVSPLVRLAYGRPGLARRLVRHGPVVLDGLEGAGMRAAWHSLSQGLNQLSYVSGLAEALPGPRELRAFFPPGWRGEPRVERLALDGSGPRPPSAGLEPLALLVSSGGAAAELPPPPHGHQWEWRAAAERLLNHASPALWDEVRRELVGLLEEPARVPAR